jgi:Zn-dependent alcohol dehydrogenase
MSHTVRAARLHEHGEPLQIETVELPEPGEDEVRVELEFAGINRSTATSPRAGWRRTVRCPARSGVRGQVI